MSDAFNIHDIPLIPVNGKFHLPMLESVEVSEFQFKLNLSILHNSQNLGSNWMIEYERALEQVEMTGELFQATLFDKWVIQTN